ncbi:MAG: hypothetical protein ACM3RP_02280 [Chitinophagales bacterium]
MKRALVTLLVLALTVLGAPTVFAESSMPGMSMPAGSPMSMPMGTAPAAPKLDEKAIAALFEAAFAGLTLTDDQAMKVHDYLDALIGPMDQLMMESDKATGAEKDLKDQEMMLLMDKTQVQIDAVLEDEQSQLLDALVFGKFPDAKAHPTDKAAVARLRAADELRAALDDHELVRRTMLRLANQMPAMPGMTMSH